MSGPLRRLPMAAGIALAALIAAAPSVSAAPTEPLTASPATGTSATKTAFSTITACPAGNTLTVLVSGGTGTGAEVPAPGKALLPATPAENFTSGAGMDIPAPADWAAWAAAGTPALSRLDGTYLVTAKCSGGQEYTTKIDFTGTTLADATYMVPVAPTPTATETKTATATATTTATATATATTTQVPVPLPTEKPKSTGPLTVTGSFTPGGAIVVTGKSFRADSPVTVGLYSAPVSLGTTVADANGTAETTVRLPGDLAAGKHTVVMLGQNAEGTPMALTADITIAGPPAPAPAPAPQSSAFPLILVIVGAIVIVAAVLGAIAYSRKRKVAEWDARLASVAAPLRDLVHTTGPAVIDRGTPVPVAMTTWNTARHAIVSTEQDLALLVSSAPDDQRKARVNRIGSTSVALVRALDEDLALRSGQPQPGMEALLTQSEIVYTQRRLDLATALTGVSAPPPVTGGAHR